MDGEQVIQPGQTSVTEPSPQQVSPTPVVAAPLALTEERVQQMIAEATALAVSEARELGRRELQSAQDRNRAELGRANQRTRIAEGVLGTARMRIQTLDPDVAKEMELAELRAKEQGRTTMEQEELAVRQQSDFHQGFIDRQYQFITDLGIDPKDKRIDWAGDAQNYLEAMERIQRSAVKIQKEIVQTLRTGLEARLKKLEVKENEEANSVNTAASPGAVAGSDAEFMKRFGSGDIEMSKESTARYNKIVKSY